MRERQLKHGLDLLAAAEQAAKDLEGQTSDPRAELSVTLAAHRRLDPTTAALLRLDDARLRQIDAMQKLAASERRREELEAVVSVLEQRITILESEREQAKEETGAELQRELQMSLEYRRQADEKLRHARRAEERARQLRLAAEKQVARERVALLHVDRDNAAATALPPPPPGSVPRNCSCRPCTTSANSWMSPRNSSRPRTASSMSSVRSSTPRHSPRTTKRTPPTSCGDTSSKRPETPAMSQPTR
ncbi:hypothetical protein [Streptomyces bungoensis]|uniref:hypothetical protein n=1 Tax=Streptomyces bungoensis TaxID=285568 RepID=UPI003409504B